MSREIELVLVDKTKNYLKYGMKLDSKDIVGIAQLEIFAYAYFQRSKYDKNVPKSVKLVIEE